MFIYLKSLWIRRKKKKILVSALFLEKQPCQLLFWLVNPAQKCLSPAATFIQVGKKGKKKSADQVKEGETVSITFLSYPFPFIFRVFSWSLQDYKGTEYCIWPLTDSNACFQLCFVTLETCLLSLLFMWQKKWRQLAALHTAGTACACVCGHRCAHARTCVHPG